MPQFSANLSTMFREYDLIDRPRAAHTAGFRAVELQFPYELDCGGLADELTEYGLSVSVINVPCGDFVQGGEGNAALPNRIGDFRDSVALAREYAEGLGALNVNVLAGTPSGDRETAQKTLADNLHYAAAAFAEIGVSVVVEAINDIDRAGFFLSTADSVIDIIDRANHPNLALQFDLYHMAMMGLPLVETYQKHADRIGHIQFADAPGRHEPGTGTIDFGPIFAAIDASAYDGWVAAEFLPASRTENSLDWMKTTW
ncbi:MAG: hydroxypyruvate isomerase [Paracoccaceae bacterium]|jgi:hydroxypyruvate isomerase